MHECEGFCPSFPNVGDSNEQNHAKLLRYIANFQTKETETIEHDWQIIPTTRFLPQKLGKFVVDRISNPDRMRLRHRPKKTVSELIF